VTKTVFIALVKENEGTRNLFSGKRVKAGAVWEFVDISVKWPYGTEWKTRVRAGVRRSMASSHCLAVAPRRRRGSCERSSVR
jgi:hypothetical protein